MRQRGKILYSWTDRRWQYGACALHSFPLQQWLHEPTSILRYTYVAFLFQQFSLRNRYKSAEFLFHRLQFWGLFCSIVLDVAFIEMNIKAKFTLLHFRLSKPSHTLRCLLHVGNTDRIWRKKIWASINFKQLVGVKKSRILVKETVLWGKGKGGCTLLVLRDDAEL